jgi:hypothetical protein
MTGNEQKRLSIYVGFIVFLIAYASIIAFIPADLLRDPDTLWHVRTGQWMLQHLEFPESDSFSYTFFGEPWIAKEWLSQLLLALAFQIGGWPGIVVLTGATCAAIAGTLSFYLMLVLRFSAALGLAAITFSLLSPHLLARPHIFAYLILCFWLFSIFQAYDGNRPPPFALAPLMIVWANIHSTFILGLFLYYIVAGFSGLRQMRSRNVRDLKLTVFATILVTLSALMTPYGIFSFTPTWTIMGMQMLARIQEWQPPNFRQSPIHLAYLVSLFALMTAFGIKLQGPRIAILMAVVWLGFSYLRGFMIFLLTIPFVFGRPAGEQVAFLKPQSPDLSPHTDPVLRSLRQNARGIAVVCVMVALAASFFTFRYADVEPPRSAAPRDAIEYVKRAQISGRVLNDYDFGGYLIFSGIPTFIDGRTELYGDAFLRKYFDIINSVDPQGAFRLLDEYGIDWVILKPAVPLAKALQGSEIWSNVYSDDTSTIYVRRH